ncbi:MAG: translation elongation factor Ts [Bacteroidales bacterium]
MSVITAADVARLRRVTGAGMMDCKKALEEAEGNFDKAIEIIRKKGQAIANKRADREASEGVVLSKVTSDGRTGMMIALNCETDFVAKNEEFVKFAYSILDKALESGSKSIEEVLALQLNGNTVAEKIIEQIGIIGEKIELSYFTRIDAEHVQPYIHPGNKLATMAGFNKSEIDNQVYKDIAMQIAAMNPVSIDKDDVTAATLASEMDIAREQARREGKPEAMLEKIAEGKLNKFFKESTLLNQEFVKDNKMTIRQYLQSADKDLTIKSFARFTLNL